MTSFKAASSSAKEAPNHRTPDIAIDEHVEWSDKLRVGAAAAKRKQIGVHHEIRNSVHFWRTPISIIGFSTIGTKSYQIDHSLIDLYVLCSFLKRDCAPVRFPVPSRPHCF
jgi:hypothetical protein